MKKRKKRAMTLMEVMIVIFIIGIIGSVVGYNMRGSMDRGKAFKTKEAISKVYNIVHLQMSDKQIKALEKSTSDQIKERVEDALKDSELVHKPSQYLVDGWNNDLIFSLFTDGKTYEIRMKSDKYEAYCTKQNKPFDYPWNEDTEPTKNNQYSDNVSNAEKSVNTH